MPERFWPVLGLSPVVRPCPVLLEEWVPDLWVLRRVPVALAAEPGR